MEETNFNVEFAKAMKGGVSSHAPSAPRAAVDYSKYKVTKRVEVKPEPVDDHEHGQSSSTSTSASSVEQDHHQKNYAPVRPIAKPVPYLKKTIPQSVSLHVDENMFKPRKERQKVYSGRSQKTGEDVPSQVQMCQANPISADDADEIFHERVRKEFPKYADREKDGWTWREMYDKLVERKKKKDNAKLEKLTSRIGKAHTGKLQGRQTMLIDAAHSHIKSKLTPTPTALQLSQARRNIKTDGKAKLHTITSRCAAAVQQQGRRSNSNSSGTVVKKVAPLMAKCRKMMLKR